MIAGWLLYILFRVEIAAVVFLVVSAAFGALHSPWALVTPLIAALLGAVGGRAGDARSRRRSRTTATSRCCSGSW